MNKTFIPNISLSQRKWYLVDAKDQKLGRISTQIATILRGKNKINFYPSIDIGDYVVIINAEKILVTGKKTDQKLYYRHSGRPGGMKIENFKSLQSRIPERILEKSIKGMLPKGKLGRQMYKRLKVFKGIEHSHLAQTPEFINL